MTGMTAPKVYLAGPMVFYADADATFRRMKRICAECGLEGVAPLDNQLELQGVPPGEELNAAIYRADVGIMKGVAGALFCVDPFRRGSEMDPGTAFEVGYCAALGLPMAGWTRDGRDYPEKVRALMADVHGAPLAALTAKKKAGATSGMLRDADGMLVHSAGLYQNLMIDMAIAAAGGRVHAHAQWTRAFRAAAADLASRVAGAAAAAKKAAGLKKKGQS
jgi:nucleoside 2-deoxyribosyltransferase